MEFSQRKQFTNFSCFFLLILGLLQNGFVFSKMAMAGRREPLSGRVSRSAPVELRPPQSSWGRLCIPTPCWPWPRARAAPLRLRAILCLFSRLFFRCPLCAPQECPVAPGFERIERQLSFVPNNVLPGPTLAFHCRRYDAPRLGVCMPMAGRFASLARRSATPKPRCTAARKGRDLKTRPRARTGRQRAAACAGGFPLTSADACCYLHYNIAICILLVLKGAS